MKKKVKLALGLFIIIILIICIYFILGNKDHTVKCYDNVDFNDIFVDISLATSGTFSISDSPEVYNKFFIEYNSIEKLLMLINSENEHEYVILISDPQESNKQIITKELEIYKQKFDEDYKNSIVGNINGYTYVVVSNNYAATLEGIIKSYMYCE